MLEIGLWCLEYRPVNSEEDQDMPRRIPNGVTAGSSDIKVKTHKYCVGLAVIGMLVSTIPSVAQGFLDNPLAYIPGVNQIEVVQFPQY